MILERGALLNNRYKIVEILGQGGMGSVYRAVDENLGTEVAVKDNLFTTDEYARQFRREAVILANLRHPNLPRVTDHFVIEGQGQYLVMDYIDGEDLRQRMDRIGLLLDEDVVNIGAAICDALTFLGSRNPPIVHRDIKPGNVKITPNGGIYLVDFGLAKVIQGMDATTTGARAMTPGYSPPEQYGTARTDQRSDIFSLGATLYAALTGTIPEDALSRAMGQAVLTPIRKHNPRVSRKLAAVIERSLEIRPDDRYRNAEEFKQAMLGAIGGVRRKTGEYTVAPAPLAIDRPLTPAEALFQPGFEEPPPSAPLRDSIPFRLGAPVEEGRYLEREERPRNRRGSCLLLGFLLLLVVVGAGGAIALSAPELAQNALRLVLPSSPTLIGILPPVPTGTPTPTAGAPSMTATTPAVLVPVTANATTTPTSPVVVLPRQTATLPPAPSPTPAATPTGGGTGQIAFASSDESGTAQIYLMNADGSNLTRLTNEMDGACQPDWSPDGQRLVFISPCESNQEIYHGSAMFLINADGSGLVALPTVPTGGDYDPAWSPDGKQIAFTSIRTTGRPRIYLLNLADNSVQRISDLYSRDYQPAWSPDGRRIAFITTRRGPAQVWIMDSDGKNQQLFSHSRDAINAYPSWSPDGNFIIFTQQARIGTFPYLVVASLEENGLLDYRIDRGPVPMREARYSPDGLWLTCESWPEGSNHDIYVMSTNGAGRHAITTEPTIDFDPVWRPGK